ncbi:hypothetical protein [Flavobacterium sp. MK4S-17]|uniref:hypothetical protein n=1 Tax=Flavobacterium sp. MK4S-17 TaxID=2543737 RepID=UPI00135B9F37|nr:hypothetical protein [Flavobacterium sp. MK4S-17]
MRIQVLIAGKPMTQQYLNNEISLKYSKSWNSGREESMPNTTLENLFLICDYFNISIEDFFKLVNTVSQKEINDEISRKVRLQKHLKK